MNSFWILCSFCIDKLEWIKSEITRILTYHHDSFWKLLKVFQRCNFDDIRYTLKLLRAEKASADDYCRFMKLNKINQYLIDCSSTENSNFTCLSFAVSFLLFFSRLFFTQAWCIFFAFILFSTFDKRCFSSSFVVDSFLFCFFNFLTFFLLSASIFAFFALMNF